MPRSTTASRWAHWEESVGTFAVAMAITAGSAAVTTFPTTPLESKCLIALAPDMTQDYLSWNWLDISERVRWDNGIDITSGRREEDELVDANQATFTIDNIDGLLSRQNPESPYYGLLSKHNPIWLMNNSGSGFKDRYFGFTSELPKRWDRSATDSTIPITCRGPLDYILRNQSNEAALAQAMLADNPIDYWKLEDPAGSTFGINSAPDRINNAVVILPNSLTFGGAAAAPGMSAPGVSYVFESVGDYIVHMGTTVAPPWSISYAVKKQNFTLPSSYDTNVVITYEENGVAANALFFGNGTLLNSNGQAWNHFLLSGYQSGADYKIELWQNGVLNSTFTSFGNTLGRLLRVRISEAGGVDTEGIGWAHFGIYDHAVDAGPHSRALQAHTGERTVARIRRVCQSVGVPFFTQAPEADSALLGAQPKGTPLEVIRDAEKTDLGVVFEHKFGLGYETLSQRYRKPVSLALDIGQGHLVDDLEPQDNTLNFHNQWTATNREGVSVIVQKDGGVPSNETIFSGEDVFNPQAVTQLADIASWLANRDSIDTDRWPNIEFMLHKHPELIDEWLAFVFGERVTVANIMSQAGIDSLDLLTEGYNERWNSKQWTVRLNTSDAAVYDITVLDNSSTRLDSGSSSITSDLNSTTTSVSVTTTNPLDLWTTDSAEWPFDIIIGGEVMTVSNVASATSPQTFTVTRSINGIVKSHIANNPLNSALSEVHIFPAAILGL